MRCNDKSAEGGKQLFVCAGCEASMPRPHALVRGQRGTAPVCATCYQRAPLDEVFERKLVQAVDAGATLPHVRRIFARLGLQDVPDAPEQLDRVMSLPLGSTRAAVRAVL